MKREPVSHDPGCAADCGGARPLTRVAIELFCGYATVSAALRARGWTVLGVDIDPLVRPDVRADCTALPLRANLRPDFVWASPPCTEFARWSLIRKNWYRGQAAADPEAGMVTVRAALDAIDRWAPAYWLMENVQGLHEYGAAGPAKYRWGPYYLWGFLPNLVFPSAQPKKPNRGWGQTPHERMRFRSRTPVRLAAAVADALDQESLPL